MKDHSCSLHSIVTKIQKNGLIPFDKALIEKKFNSFYLSQNENPKYIQPFFTEILSNIETEKFPKILLISAAGATGKTELTNFLSTKLQMPIFDLSKHEPVASNSLSGLFTNCLGYRNAGIFVDQLQQSKAVLIIDALDEASVQTTVKGFNSFLDDISNIASNSLSTTFILLGRTKVMEHCMFYFDKKGIDASLFLIEPFTVSQAKEFIDKHTQDSNKRFEEPYKKVRDYIVDSVQAFFKSQNDINKTTIYKQFIGYAPVLLSIAKLLDETPNYAELKETLSRDDNKNVDLIVSIVEQILLREQYDKIGKLVLPNLLKDRPSDFCDMIRAKAYSIDEQCLRLLNYQLNYQFNTPPISEDCQFNTEYENKISEWLKEHPFMDERGNIQNAVFESYIIARLMLHEEYKSVVIEYLNTKYRDAFMLFFIFDKLSKDRKIDATYLSYLYSSLKSLDSQHMTSSIDIHEDSLNTGVLCDVGFSINNAEDYFQFKMLVPFDDFVFLGDSISDITVDASINILLNKIRAELIAPVTLICKNVKVNSGEIIVEKGIDQLPHEIIIECDNFEIDYTNGHSLSLINHLSKNDCFQIIAKERPVYPFGDYYIGSDYSPSFDDLLNNEDLKTKYKKLRKIIVLFKSHSKGRMAKFKDKIENQRVAGTGIGKMVLNQLIQTGVLYLEGYLYFIDPHEIDVQLGVSYHDIRAGVINKKTIEFLQHV